jgi:hypothetical protein
LRKTLICGDDATFDTQLRFLLGCHHRRCFLSSVPEVSVEDKKTLFLLILTAWTF